MDEATKAALSKVPEVTFSFWIIKIAATTLGERGRLRHHDAELRLPCGHGSLSCGLDGISAWQIAAKKFHPFLYWATIIASTTFGTTMADFADRSWA